MARGRARRWAHGHRAQTSFAVVSQEGAPVHPFTSIRTGLHEPGAIPLLIVVVSLTVLVCSIVKHVVQRVKR